MDKLLVWTVVFFVNATPAFGQEDHDLDREIDLLIQELRDEETSFRRLAVDDLGNIGPPAVPALLKTLQDKAGIVRVSAADALGAIGTEAKSAVPALTKALQDEHQDVRRSAAQSLGRINTDPKLEND